MSHIQYTMKKHPPVALHPGVLAVAEMMCDGYLIAINAEPADDLAGVLNVDIVLSNRPRWITSPMVRFVYDGSERLAVPYFNWINTPIYHIHLIANLEQIAFLQESIGKKICLSGEEIAVLTNDRFGNPHGFFWQHQSMVDLLELDYNSQAALTIRAASERVRKSGMTACHSVLATSLTLIKH